MVLCLVLLPTSYSNSQTVDPNTGLPLQSTGNVLNLGNGLPWTGTVTGQAGGQSGGGSIAAYNPSTGNIIFSYSNATVSQSANINKALATAGTGIQLAGYNYSWGINNDLSNGGGNRGTLTGNVSLLDSSGHALESFNYNYSQTNTGSNFQTFSGTQLFSNQYQLSAVDTLKVSFTGHDQNWWAGYWGPRVHVDSVSLLYTVDPCKTNPAYGPQCAGFKDVIETGNLAPNPSAWGQNMTQAYAINTALQNAGIGAMVHGVTYGFDYSVGGDQCTSSFLFWCTGTSPSTLNVSFSLTSSGGQTMYNRGFSYTGQQSGSVNEKFLFPSSVNQTLMGSAILTSSGWGDSSVGNFRSTLIYTPDPCANNPLYSSTCTGYGAAFAKQLTQSTASTTSTSTTVTDTSTIITAPVVTVQPTVQSSTQTASVTPTDTSSQTQQTQSSPLQSASAPSSSPVTSAAPSATNPQPKPGDITIAGSNKSVSSSSSSGPSALAMSVVASVQAKVGATEKAAVQQANDAAATATAQAVQTAESVAGSAQATSIASATSQTTTTQSVRTTASTQSSTSSLVTQSNAQAQAQAASALKPNSTTLTADLNTSNETLVVTQALRPTNNDSSKDNNNAQQQNNIQSVQMSKPQDNTQSETQQVEVATFTMPVAPKQQESVQTITQQSVTSFTPPVAPEQSKVVVQEIQVAMVTPTIQPSQQNIIQSQSVVQQFTTPLQAPMQQSPVDYSLTAPSVFNDSFKRTESSNSFAEVEIPKVETLKMGTRSTLNDYMNEKPFMSLLGMEPTQDGMVKRNVQPNEVAGGVDIASMATQPKGYEAYAQMTLKDAAFYKVEDIYKNQKTVDNVRLLRGLTGGSDRLHQEMVEQQYRLGN